MVAAGVGEEQGVKHVADPEPPLSIMLIHPLDSWSS